MVGGPAPTKLLNLLIGNDDLLAILIVVEAFLMVTGESMGDAWPANALVRR
ncbi:MAG: hypothetical protein ACFFCP_12185 [Promethearchaeota archaeon]